MPIKGEKARKIKALKQGKGVRPPKAWWTKWRRRIGATKKYRGFSKERKSRIIGGIWSGYSTKTKINVVKEYQK